MSEHEPVEGIIRPATAEQRERLRAEGFPEDVIAAAKTIDFTVEVHQETETEAEAESDAD
jgi:hypothetical protein